MKNIYYEIVKVLLLSLLMIQQTFALAFAEEEIICKGANGNPLPYEGTGACSGRMRHELPLNILKEGLSLVYSNDPGYIGADFGIQNWGLNIVNQIETDLTDGDLTVRYGNGWISKLSKNKLNTKDYYFNSWGLLDIIPDYFETVGQGYFRQYGVNLDYKTSLDSTYVSDYTASILNEQIKSSSRLWQMLKSVQDIQTGAKLNINFTGSDIEDLRDLQNSGEGNATTNRPGDGHIIYPDKTRIIVWGQWKKVEGDWFKEINLKNGKNKVTLIMDINRLLVKAILSPEGKPSRTYTMKYKNNSHYVESDTTKPELYAALLTDLTGPDLKMNVVYDERNRVARLAQAENGGSEFATKYLRYTEGAFRYVKTFNADSSMTLEKFDKDGYLVETKSFYYGQENKIFNHATYRYDDKKKLLNVRTPESLVMYQFDPKIPSKQIGYDIYELDKAGKTLAIKKVSEVNYTALLRLRRSLDVKSGQGVEISSEDVAWTNIFPHYPLAVTAKDGSKMNFSYSYPGNFLSGPRTTTIRKTNSSGVLYEELVYRGDALVKSTDFTKPAVYQIRTYKYDADGSLIQLDFDNGQIEKYDDQGRVIYSKDQTGTVKLLTYNNYGEVATETTTFPTGIVQKKTFACRARDKELCTNIVIVTDTTGQPRIVETMLKDLYLVNGEEAWRE